MQGGKSLHKLHLSRGVKSLLQGRAGPTSGGKVNAWSAAAARAWSRCRSRWRRRPVLPSALGSRGRGVGDDSGSYSEEREVAAGKVAVLQRVSGVRKEGGVKRNAARCMV